MRSICRCFKRICRDTQTIGYGMMQAVGAHIRTVFPVGSLPWQGNSGCSIAAFGGIAGYGTLVLHVFHCFFIKEIFGMLLRPEATVELGLCSYCGRLVYLLRGMAAP